MGQSSSPLLKKLGQNLHWNTIWNDKINYTKKLKEDIFINMFFFLIFKKISSKTIFLKSYYFKNLLNSHLTKWLQVSTNYCSQNVNYNKTIFFKKNKAAYIGKIWIFKFNKWLILVANYYVPQFTKFNKEIIKQKKNIQKSVYNKQLKILQLYTKFFLKKKNYFL